MVGKFKLYRKLLQTERSATDIQRRVVNHLKRRDDVIWRYCRILRNTLDGDIFFVVIGEEP